MRAHVHTFLLLDNRSEIKSTDEQMCTVADPGFHQGGGANSRGRGAPTYDFAKNSQKPHEIERIWTPWGRPSCPP